MLPFARVLPALLAFLVLIATPAAAAEDPRDKAAVQEVLQSVLETEKSGVAVPWSSSSTGNAGTVEVERTFFPSPGRPCREYTRTIVTPNGKKTIIHGTGCRTAANNWTLEEDTSVAKEPKKAPETDSEAKKDDTPPKKAEDSTARKPKKTAKPKETVAKKTTPPLLEYSLPTSSSI